MSIQPGTDIGRYHILEQLGEGGMAVVYKAYDTRLESDVAVKVIRAGDITPNALPRILKRFQIEAKKMAQLTHPNIVRVLDYGDYENTPFLVMPYLSGGTLKEFLGKPMAGADAARLLLPIARALAYANKRGLVHRDVKPSNILITETGDPMLTDFGIAKLLVSEETLDLTSTGMGVGTPEYMAPEQASGSTFDHRADIYSLGIVLYEMVTGRKPFTADTPMAVVIKQATDPLPRPTSYNPDLSLEVEQVLFKSLAKDPNARYADMSLFAAALEKLLILGQASLKKVSGRLVHESDTISDPNNKSSTIPKKPFDTRWLIGGLGVVGLGLVIFAGIKMLGGESSKVGSADSQSTEVVIIGAENSLPVSPEIGGTMASEKDGMTLVYVPEGEFEMGSEDGDDDEQPMHTVYLDAYWIDQTEVTNSQYSGCVQSGACGQPLSPALYSNSNISDHPVVFVGWNDAIDYCAWAGRRLPTEAEWEKAARGTDGRTYPWGEGITCSQANYGDCDDFPSTSPVGYYGEKGASPYDAYDMAGNVWEWTADRYTVDFYQESPRVNPSGPNNGNIRVVRGGSWLDNEWDARSADRNQNLARNADFSIGFRCALDAASH